MSRKRRAAARASPVARATSLSVRVGWSASNARITASPRCSDCTKSVSRSASPVVARPVPALIADAARPGRLELAKHAQLFFGRRHRPSEGRRDAELPTRRGPDLAGADAGMNARQHELARERIGLEHAEVGDHRRRPTASQAEPPACLVTRPVPHRGDEVEALDEALPRLTGDDDHLATGGGDLGRPARAREANLRTLVRRADDRRVDVRVAVDLRRAEEADVDAAGCSQ